MVDRSLDDPVAGAVEKFGTGDGCGLGDAVRRQGGRGLGLRRGRALGFGRGHALGFRRGHPLGFRRGRALGFRNGRALVLLPRARRSGYHQGPAEHLDIQPGNRAAVHGVVAAIERLAQGGRGIRANGAIGPRPAARTAAGHSINDFHRQFHSDLVPLAHVAHVCTRPLRRGNARRAFRDNGGRLVPHTGEHLANQVGVKVGQTHVAAANDLVRDRRQEEPHRRADPGIARHQEAVQPQFVGHSRRVNRRRPPERDHRAALDTLAPLDRVGPRGVGHVLVHHLAHPQRGHPGIEPQPCPHEAPDRRLGPTSIQRNGAAGEQLRVDPPQNHVRIGHGGLLPTPPVRRRTRLGPRARRPHVNAVQIVYPRDRPSPGADLDHLDHRNPHGQPAALLETVAARHLEGAGVERLAAVDHAQLGGGAPHVEREHVAQVERAGQVAGQNRASGRAGLDEADRGRHGRLQRRQAASRRHEQEGAVKPGVAQRRRQTPQIA